MSRTPPPYVVLPHDGSRWKRASLDSPPGHSPPLGTLQPHVCDSIRGRPNSARSEGTRAPAPPQAHISTWLLPGLAGPLLLILKKTGVVPKWVSRALDSMTGQHWAFSKKQKLVHPLLSTRPQKAPVKPGSETSGPGSGATQLTSRQARVSSDSRLCGCLKRRSTQVLSTSLRLRGQKTGV